MEFVTIHDLSRELNVPSRVIRYRFVNLVMDGKLKENDDYRRDDYKDEQHFTWKIHPLRFMQESGLKPVVNLATKEKESDAKLISTDNKIVNESLPPVNQVGNQHAASSVEPPNVVTKTDNKAADTGNNSDDSVNQTGNKTAEAALSREMIDLLKEQLKIKDGQLKDQGKQLSETHSLNVRLTGTVVRQNEKIENLLRLTGGSAEVFAGEPEMADQPSDVIHNA